MNGPGNEFELDVTLHRVTLRDFDYRLEPLPPELRELSPGVFLRPELGAGGIELAVLARDTGLEIVLRFERSEFVSVATGGLAMLDAADATREEGRG